MSAGPPPGALLAVASDGGVSFAAAGWAVRPDKSDAAGPPMLDAGVPMAWETRTDAGSVTKIVATTAAAMVLADAGELDVDAPAERYLPALTGRGITVRHLLEHRAGLWEWWPLYLTATGDAAVAAAAALPPRYRVDAGRHYSDLGFILLGEVVARIAGAPLADAAHRLVFGPWGLADTRFRSPAPGAPVAASSAGDAIERRMVETGVPYPVHAPAAGFSWRTHQLVGEVNDGNAFHAFAGAAGHAGVFTTAADLLAFAERMLRDDSPVRRETALAFTTPGVDPGQAQGFRVWSDPAGRAIGHTGFPGVAFALLPEEGASVVMITNRLHAEGVPATVEPASTETMWELALRAARAHLADRR